jgi:hypothetical protein
MKPIRRRHFHDGAWRAGMECHEHLATLHSVAGVRRFVFLLPAPVCD